MGPHGRRTRKTEARSYPRGRHGRLFAANQSSWNGVDLVAFLANSGPKTARDESKNEYSLILLLRPIFFWEAVGRLS